MHTHAHTRARALLAIGSLIGGLCACTGAPATPSDDGGHPISDDGGTGSGADGGADGGTGPGTPGTANLFVAATGDDSGANCKRFDPAAEDPDPSGATVCASFDRAYQLAQPGDVVEVAGGSYGVQVLGAKTGAAPPNVRFRPAVGAQVTLSDLTTEGDAVTLEQMTIDTGAAHVTGWSCTGSDVVLDGVHITGPYARVAIGGGAGGTKNVTWKNGSLGTPGNTLKRLCDEHDPEPVELFPSQDLVFSNLDFYPFIADLGNPNCGPDSNMHLETVRVNDGVQHFRLERSRFHRGDGSGTARLFVTKLSGDNSDDLTVVNNWFGASDGEGGGSYSVVIGGNQECKGYVFAYNHFEQGFDPACAPKTSLKLVGNTGSNPSYICEGTENIRNLWTWPSPGTCGTDQWIDDAMFSLAALGYGPDGYHLTAGSPAIDSGETAECMALTGGVDIDGQPRSGVCDTGPDEYVP